MDDIDKLVQKYPDLAFFCEDKERIRAFQKRYKCNVYSAAMHVRRWS